MRNLRTCFRFRRVWIGIRAAALAVFLTYAAWSRADDPLRDISAGYVHFVPAVVWTTNGCAEFVVNVEATLTNARVFSFQFFVDSAAVQLLEVLPGSAAGLHVMPELLRGDTLWLDGFFDDEVTGPNLNLAVLRLRAVAPDDAISQIQFVQGRGYGGEPGAVDTIYFAGGVCVVNIEGTPPRPPDSVVIITQPYPAHDDSVLVLWRRVTRDLDGDAVTNPLYTLYLTDVRRDTTFVATTTYDTSYWCPYVVHEYWPGDVTVNAAIIRVTACKTQP